MIKDYYDIINPYNQRIIGQAPIHSKDYVNQVLQKAFKYKCDLTASQRLSLLNRACSSIKNNKKTLSELISKEAGLCLKNSNYEVDRAVKCLEFCVLALKSISSENLTQEFIINPNKHDPKLTVLAEPMDLVIGITPFNHPLNMVIHKVGPSIVTGSPIVIKPSEKTPLTAFKLRELLIKEGLPDQMFQVVSGIPPKNIVDQLLSFKGIEFVSFTGGVRVGKYIARKLSDCGNELIKYAPELGGNAVFVVMNDCDVKLASHLSLGAFENSGQRCTAIRRILVQEGIYDQFLDEFVKKQKISGMETLWIQRWIWEL